MVSRSSATFEDRMESGRLWVRDLPVDRDGWFRTGCHLNPIQKTGNPTGH